LAIETALRVLQKEYKADVAGFCKELRIEDIHLWEELMDDWDNTFSETPIEVVVDYHITGYQRRTSR
jgi:spore germination protein